MRISCVTFDCADPARMVAFWSTALGYEPQGHCCYPPDGVGPYLEFVPVPEGKTVKNRVHLGFNAADLDAEISRLVELGATVAWEEDFPDAWHQRNVILRDPEGNELCLGTSNDVSTRRIAKDVAGVLARVADRGDPDVADDIRRAREQLTLVESWPIRYR